MNRRQLVEKCFQRGDQLTLASAGYRSSVDSLLRWLMASDQVEGDVTTQALQLREHVTASVVARQAGTLAGADEARFLLSQWPEITVEPHADDGSPIEVGQVILSLSAEVSRVLGLERTILNLLGRMSGIATQTRRLVTGAGNGPDGPYIAATRKTPWMLLDKRAVYLGGGLTHRLSLGDSILVKDNHLAAFRRQTSSASVEAALPQVVHMLAEASRPPRDFFEVEVENASQARAVLSAFEATVRHQTPPPTLVIMLDNFGAGAATAFIREIRGESIYANVLFEASGDITEETLPTWSNSGVDVLSLGALTHSVKNFNLSMTIH
jgi:nicotinate-nucleotide pyrophosphorylase (carboxylating)